MSYILLRVHWCHIIVLNVHASTEDKIDDLKDSFYKESDQIPTYHMNILLGDFNAKEATNTFLNQKLGMNVYNKLVMIMELG
jgi:hypothetical protein